MFPQVSNRNLAISALQLGYLNINGMRLDFNDDDALTINLGNLSVTDGQCRDCTNTNDILVSTVNGVTPINLLKAGLNGVDGTIVPGVTLQPDMQIYVYAIASSSNLQLTPPDSSPGLTGQPPLNISIYQTNPSLAYEQALLVSNPGAVYPNVPVQYPAGFIVSLNNPMGAVFKNNNNPFTPPLNAPLLPAGYDMYRYIGAVTISPNWAFIADAKPLIADFTATSDSSRQSTFFLSQPVYNLNSTGTPLSWLSMLVERAYLPYTLAFSVDSGTTTYAAVPLTAQKVYLRLYLTDQGGGGTLPAGGEAVFSVTSSAEFVLPSGEEPGGQIKIVNLTGAAANVGIASDVFEVLLDEAALTTTIPGTTVRPTYVLRVSVAQLLPDPATAPFLSVGLIVVGWSDNI